MIPLFDVLKLIAPAMTDMEAFQWATGTMIGLFFAASGVATWIVVRLQEIPNIVSRQNELAKAQDRQAQSQDDNSNKVKEMALFLVRVDAKVENLKEDFDDIEKELHDVRDDVKEILKLCQGDHAHNGSPKLHKISSPK